MMKRRIASMVVCAGALAVSVTALADNNFCAPAICTVLSGSIQYNSDASITNVGSTQATVICPIDRASFGATSKLQAAAFVASTSPKFVSCSVSTHNASSGTGFSTGSVINTGSGSRESLPFSAISHVGTFDYDYMTCSLDAGGSLFGFRGIEQ